MRIVEEREEEVTLESPPLQDTRQWNGYPVCIENEKGTTRSGTDIDGNEWESKLYADYGYFEGVVGSDGDYLDVYMGEDPSADEVHIIKQIIPETGEFDEYKVLVDFPSQHEALETYLKCYDRYDHVDGMTSMSVEKFIRKLESAVA